MNNNVNPDTNRRRLAGLRGYFLLALAFWSLTFIGLSLWQLQHIRGMTMEMAEQEARANFNKDQAFRFWATLHGGVYVPVSGHTPPNPYLSHLPERDITTESGRALTLMNPAYMLRMLNEQYGELFGVRGRITSRHPLRPENMADPWENEALRAFEEEGVVERLEISKIDGQPWLRYMAPMVTEQGCLLCHAHQGYQVGDIRGGVSVAVPLDGYLRHEQDSLLHTIGSLLVIWLLGLLGLTLGYRRLCEDSLRQQQANEEIRALNRRLETAQSMARIGNWELDLASNRLWWSDEIYRIFGLQPQQFEATYEAFLSTIHPDDREMVDQAYQEAVAKGMPYEITHRILTADGELKYVHERSEEIRNAQGEVIRSQGTVQDVTELEQAKRRLHEHQQNLEKLVDERTAELAQSNKKLIRARDAADAANRAKSVFLANMSHELRTPLNAIIGFTRLAQRDPGMAEETRENLGFVLRNSEHLLSLINDVLDMAKVESGRMQLDEGEVDLPTLLHDSVETMRQQAQERGLALVLEVAEGLPLGIYADGRKLRQTLFNLLSNAIKFSEHGTITVSAKVSGEHLQLQVSDQGSGMSREEAARLFEPFYQAGEQINGEGTGLGMPITRQFVQLMGGEIRVESEPGVGTVFTIELPLEPAVLSEDRQQQVSRRVTALAAGEQAWRVLVVDDAEANRRLLTRLLGKVGFRVREAANGAEALSLWHEWQPHFIWMDLRMPVMDGYQACQQIRAESGGERPCIVALTASSTMDDRHKVMDAGFDEIMRKPFDEERLFATMGRLLGLEYQYEEGDTEPTSQAQGAALKGLVALPADLREALQEALLSGEMDELERLSDKIAEIDSELAGIFIQRARSYDFAALLAELEEMA